MGWFYVLGYFVGFAITFRFVLRRTLTRYESRSHREFYFFEDATPYIQAFFAAVFWPITWLCLMLILGVQSEQQEAKERAATEAKQRKEREEFKKKARDLNIPGWEHL